jgi:hypothetical protein
MPSLPPTITADLYYDGAWNDITYGVRQTSAIEISRGTTSEGNQPDPNELTAVLDNGTGNFSPKNPNSNLFGKIGRNTPVRFNVQAGKPWLQVPTGAGDARARTPDNAALDIVGDIDVRFDAQLENWNNGSITELISKQTASTNQRSWRFLQLADGTLEFTWTTDGTAATGISIISSEVLHVPPSQRIALRATLDVNNGLGGYTQTFYTASTINGPWTLFGTQTVTTAATTSIFNSTAPLDVGDAEGITLVAPVGRFYAAQVRSGLDGTLVADADFTSLAVGTTGWTDSVGRVWATENGATISNTHARIVGEVPAWPPRRTLSGYATVPVAPAGILRRLGSGSKPLKSAAFRSITFNDPDAPIREYWPFEDGGEATAITSGLENGILATISGDIDMASSSAFASSAPLPQMGTSVVHMTVRSYTVTGESQMRFFLNIPSGGTTADAILARISTTGTARTFKLQYNVGGALTLIMYDADGVRLDDTGPVVFALDGKLVRVSIGLTQNGANVDITLGTLEPNASSALVFTDTLVSGTIGRVTSMSVGSPADLGATVQGHVTFQSAETNLFDIVEQLDAYTGERAGSRIIRLCDEQNVTASYAGVSTDHVALGPQRINKFTELLLEAATSDQGYLLEARDALEIFYRSRATMYNQTPVLTLDYSQGVISPPFEPIDDDKLTRNNVIVTVDGGSSSSPATLDSGPMSTQDPPNGVGLYDVEYTYSLADLETAEDLSMWLLHTGTYDGLRYTKITLNLANDRVAVFATDIMNADVGDLIRLTNLPDDLPPGDVDLIIIGYTETMGPDEWKISFVCIPGEPFNVAEAATAQLAFATNLRNRADTTDSSLFVAADTDDTSLQVLVAGTYDKWCEAYPVLNSNARFEVDTTGWSANNSTILRVATPTNPSKPGFDGSYSLQVTPNGSSAAGGADGAMTAVGTITAADDYYASGWVMSHTAWADVRVAADFYNSAGTFISSVLGSASSIEAGVWTHLSQTLTAPALASRVVMRFRFGSTPAATVVFFVDELRIRHAGVTAFSGLYPDEFPFDARISGEIVGVESCMPIVYDHFNRTAASSWGNAESGQAWTISGGTGTDYNVASGVGTQLCSAVNSSRRMTIDKGYTDVDISVHIAANALSTGGSQFGCVMGRYTDTSNSYYARLDFTTTATINFSVRKLVGAVDSVLVTQITLPFTHVAARLYGVRLQIVGTTVRGKAWDTTVAGSENKDWDFEVTDTDLTTGNLVACRSIVASANTNVNPVIAYDNFTDRAPQVFQVERSKNTVVKSLPVSSDVALAYPMIVAL